MENINIQGSHDGYFVPTVNFDSNTGICEIAGESFLEETNVFYKPLILWLKNFIATNKPITFNCKLTYFVS